MKPATSNPVTGPRCSSWDLACDIVNAWISGDQFPHDAAVDIERRIAKAMQCAYALGREAGRQEAMASNG